jgi:hypothetical protein
LTSQAEDLGQQLEITKDSAARDIKANKDLQSRARERLDTNYKKEISEMDESFRNYTHDSRETQKESYEMQKAKYHKDKEKTLGTLNESYQKQLEGSDREIRAERDFRKEEVGTLKERMNDQAEAMRKSFRKTLDRDRAFNEEMIEARSIDQKDSMATVKMRYQDALKDNLNSTNSSQQTFKKNVSDRMGSKIESLESELAETENQALATKIKTQKSNEYEKNNIRRDMKQSLDMVNEQRKKAIEVERSRSQDEVGEVQDESQKKLHSTIRGYQNQISEMQGKHRVQMTEKDSIHDWQSNQLNKQTGAQVNNVKEQFVKEQKNLVDYYENNLADTKDNHRKDKIDFQAKYAEERNQSITSLNKKLQELERQYAVEKDKQKITHMSQIEELTYNHRLDKHRTEKKHKGTVEELQKSHARELQFTKAASENKLEAITKQHREEMQRLEDKHTQQMASLASHKPKV